MRPCAPSPDPVRALCTDDPGTEHVLVAPSTWATTGVMAGTDAAGAGPEDTGPEGADMKVLVLGGTSFIGRAVAEHLLRRGDQVALFHRGRA